MAFNPQEEVVEFFMQRAERVNHESQKLAFDSLGVIVIFVVLHRRTSLHGEARRGGAAEVRGRERVNTREVHEHSV